MRLVIISSAGSSTPIYVLSHKGAPFQMFVGTFENVINAKRAGD